MHATWIDCDYRTGLVGQKDGLKTLMGYLNCHFRLIIALKR